MRSSTIIFFLINLVVMFVYAAFVSGAHQLAVMEGRDYYDFGDSLNFMMFLPVLLFCLIVNIVWGVMGLVAIVRRRDYHSAVGCVIAVTLWMVVILVAREMAYLSPNEPR